MSEKTVDCKYLPYESEFIGGIDPSLIRDAAIREMKADDFLDLCLISLKGILSKHLKESSLCRCRMSNQLHRRMWFFHKYGDVGDQCERWCTLLYYAVKGDSEYSTHVRNCTFCQRDIRQIRAKLPHYQEFEILKEED